MAVTNPRRSFSQLLGCRDGQHVKRRLSGMRQSGIHKEAGSHHHVLLRKAMGNQRKKGPGAAVRDQGNRSVPDSRGRQLSLQRGMIAVSAQSWSQVGNDGFLASLPQFRCNRTPDDRTDERTVNQEPCDHSGDSIASPSLRTCERGTRFSRLRWSRNSALNPVALSGNG